MNPCYLLGVEYYCICSNVKEEVIEWCFTRIESVSSFGVEEHFASFNRPVYDRMYAYRKLRKNLLNRYTIVCKFRAPLIFPNGTRYVNVTSWPHAELQL